MSHNERGRAGRVGRRLRQGVAGVAAVVGLAFASTGLAGAAGYGPLQRALLTTPTGFAQAAASTAGAFTSTMQKALAALTTSGFPYSASSLWEGSPGGQSALQGTELVAFKDPVLSPTQATQIVEQLCTAEGSSTPVSHTAISQVPGGVVNQCTAKTAIAVVTRANVLAVVTYAAVAPDPTAATAASTVAVKQYGQLPAGGVPVSASPPVAGSPQKVSATSGILSIVVILAAIAAIILYIRRRRRGGTKRQAPSGGRIAAVLGGSRNRLGKPHAVPAPIPDMAPASQSIADRVAPFAGAPSSWQAAAMAPQASVDPFSQSVPMPAPAPAAVPIGVPPAQAPASALTVGWHPDQTDQLVQRYWDGTAWTRFIRWDVDSGQWHEESVHA